MRDIINIAANRIACEQMVGEYYSNFFSEYPHNELFEIYDIESEQFVAFPGREGSKVVNRNTLIKKLTEMESNHGRIEGLLVLQHDAFKINFREPVFIGKVDAFYAQN